MRGTRRAQLPKALIDRALSLLLSEQLSPVCDDGRLPVVQQRLAANRPANLLLNSKRVCPRECHLHALSSHAVPPRSIGQYPRPSPHLSWPRGLLSAPSRHILQISHSTRLDRLARRLLPDITRQRASHREMP